MSTDDTHSNSDAPLEQEKTKQDTFINDSDTHQDQTAAPAQIPLLEDVVFHTSLPLKAPTRKAKPSLGPGESAPRPTDLFGGTPETAVSGPLSPDYPATDIDQERTKVKSQASRVVDSLVEEYSAEIVRRLRDDLTTLLDELDIDKTDSEKN